MRLAISRCPSASCGRNSCSGGSSRRISRAPLSALKMLMKSSRCSGRSSSSAWLYCSAVRPACADGRLLGRAARGGQLRLELLDRLGHQDHAAHGDDALPSKNICSVWQSLTPRRRRPPPAARRAGVGIRPYTQTVVFASAMMVAKLVSLGFRPDLVLVDRAGEPFEIQSPSRSVTLLIFIGAGYTDIHSPFMTQHCPCRAPRPPHGRSCRCGSSGYRVTHTADILRAGLDTAEDYVLAALTTFAASAQNTIRPAAAPGEA